MSATYRQSSKATPELEQRDPEKPAAGPRVAIPFTPLKSYADQALASAGPARGASGAGPSVKPYQPEGLWGRN